jgi:hypothetical protein
MKVTSETKQKILLLLLAGITLGLTKSSKGYFSVLKNAHKDWKEIDRQKLYRVIREFYALRLIRYKESPQKTIEIILTEDGKKKALEFQLNNIHIKIPSKWDKKWRMIIFDIPEKLSFARTVFRKKIEELGFRQIQKSIYIFPFECENEINFITEIFDLRPYIRFLHVLSFTNEEEFILKFKLQNK